MRWPQYWSFSFSIIPSKVIPGLISFRMDWLDLLAVQRTLKSLLHHQLLELAQTHVHRGSDAIQLSHPLSSTSPSALTLSQHQGLFK